MKSSTIVFTAVLLAAGCAATDERAENLLAQGDARMIAEDYSSAIAAYVQFVAAQPDHAQAARASATLKVLERLTASQAAIGRAQKGSDATRRELAERQAESDRAKAESDRLRSEVAKLRADLERLRNIDLKTQKK